MNREWTAIEEETMLPMRLPARLPTWPPTLRWLCVVCVCVLCQRLLFCIIHAWVNVCIYVCVAGVCTCVYVRVRTNIITVQILYDRNNLATSSPCQWMFSPLIHAYRCNGSDQRLQTGKAGSATLFNTHHVSIRSVSRQPRKVWERSQD